jgi:hypothetical protein
MDKVQKNNSFNVSVGFSILQSVDISVLRVLTTMLRFFSL